MTPRELATPRQLDQTRRWIESLFADPGYRFAHGRPRTLLATSFAIGALATMGSVEGPRARAAAAWIATRQAPSGLFSDPLFGRDVRWSTPGFSPLYIAWQHTFFALEALDALGTPPRHDLAFIEPLSSPAALDLWLSSMAFSDFQRVGNFLRFVFAFFARRDGADSPAAHHLLDRLAERRAASGFWGTGDPKNAMAGSAHVFRHARALGRELVTDAAIEATLATQRDDGLFGEEPSVDLGAIEILARRRDARAIEALRKAQPALRRQRNTDGSYRWNDRNRRIAMTGLEPVSANATEGDVWSTYMRVRALQLIEEAMV